MYLFPLLWKDRSLGGRGHFCEREAARYREGWTAECLFFPNACPASPQSPTGTWQQWLHDIPALACCTEKGALSLAQSLVPWAPRRVDASIEPINSLRHREICLICHLLPVIFLVSGQEGSKSYYSMQTHQQQSCVAAPGGGSVLGALRVGEVVKEGGWGTEGAGALLPQACRLNARLLPQLENCC